MIAAPPVEECTHPEPVTGILANEFGHYAGAKGPEGVRRTVTMYGPVIGGLPLQAWHCETCGLLKITYPDGRNEERRLYPGPQPGLLRKPEAIDPSAEVRGRQARVSGLSRSQELEIAFESREVYRPTRWDRIAAACARAGREFYALPGFAQIGAAAWTVALFGLLAVGIMSVYTYKTPAMVTGTLWVTGTFSLIGLICMICVFIFPQPPLSPSPADTSEHASLSSATKAAITFLVFSIILGALAGFLAVYDYKTPGAEGLVVVVSLVFFALGVVVFLGESITNHYNAN